MGNEVNPIEATWLNFVKSLHPLLAARLEDRPLDQYLQFPDDVLALVEGPDFTTGLNSAWPSPPYPSLPPDQTRVHDLLLAELRAFPIAVEVAQGQEKTSAGEKGWIGRWLGRAATITDSVKDIIDNAPPLVNGGLKLLGELLDLFKGD